MNRRIIICGGNGSGKSTLGKALADAMGIKFMDNEDYYFPKRESDYKYDHALTREEFMPILQNDMEQAKDWIFASVKGNYGEQIESMLTACGSIILLTRSFLFQPLFAASSRSSSLSLSLILFASLRLNR